MYTGTIFNWHDNSAFEESPVVADAVNRPLFMVVNSFDKGPEKLMEVDATTFNSLFGTMSFERHGQGALQAQNIINAGGRILIKRVCAANSELANSILVAKVTSKQLQKVNAEGLYIYEDAQGNETTDSTHIDEVSGEVVDNTKVMVDGAVISWSVESATGAKTFDDVKKYAKSLLGDDTYPLFIITDNGRGVSNKAVKIVPDYDTSRGLEQMIYRFMVYEGTTMMEACNMSFDPEYKFDNEYYGMDKNRNIQVSAEVIPELFEEYIAYLAKTIYGNEYTQEQVNLLKQIDTIYGYGYNGNLINGLAPETDDDGNIVGIDLNTSYGVTFGNTGSYGSYGVDPANQDNQTTYEVWGKDIAGVYQGFDTDGSNIDEVWDVDSHKIFAICDANYPLVVKDAIAEFVTFRQDCIFFRDLGIGYNTLIAIKNRYNDITSKYFDRKGIDNYKIKNLDPVANNFIADYLTTYEIVNGDTRKNIRVTMMYDLCIALTDMYLTSGPFTPLAGSYNGFILRSAIPGTVNYTPIVTPTVNQKEAIDNMKINYAIFQDADNCIVQSTYSSQKALTQLSFVCNTMAIQEVMRVVREQCPRYRFSVISSNTLATYSQYINRVLESFQGYFTSLEFTYTEDPLSIQQKIFYASIRFAFPNWEQTEIFDLYAINKVS